MNQEQARHIALAIPDVEEKPHHHFASFRINNKIIATMPPNTNVLHIFVPEEIREPVLAMQPDIFEKLFWGKKVVGLKTHLDHAKPKDIQPLLEKARELKL